MSRGSRDVPMSAHSRRTNDAAHRPGFGQEGNLDMLYLRVLNTLPCYHQERP